MLASTGEFGFGLRKRIRGLRVDRRRRLGNRGGGRLLDRLDVDGPALLTDVHRRSSLQPSTSLHHGAWYRAAGLATDRWPFLARLGDCVQPPHRLGGQASREIRGSNISVPGAPVCGLGTLSADRQGI